MVPLVSCTLLLLCGACFRPPAPVVERRLAGELHRGEFVPPHAYEYYLHGELALEHGQPAQAREAFELALAQRSRRQDAYVLSRLALAQARTDDLAAATRSLQEAAKLAPCLPELWVVRGDIAREQDQPRGALGHYHRALECQPGYGPAEKRLVDTLLQVGARERAAEVLRTLGAPGLPGTQSSALEPAALSRDARVLELERALARGDRETLHRLLPTGALHDSLPPALYARVLSALGRTAEAVIAWSQAAPLPPALLPEAARDYARAGAWDEALAAAEAALGSEPSETTARALHEVVAQTRMACGDTPGALQALPAQSTRSLGQWLQQSGEPGLAAELSATAAR